MNADKNKVLIFGAGIILVVLAVTVVKLIYENQSLKSAVQRSGAFGEQAQEQFVQDDSDLPGTIGEQVVKAEESIGNEVPAHILNTEGTVLNINKGDTTITVQGSGFNFADQTSRILTIQVTPDTTFIDQVSSKRVTGPAGMDMLAQGDSIAIESSLNIRGRDTFPASYIIILE